MAVLTTYDAANDTIIRLSRFQGAVKRLDEQTHETKQALLSVLQSASKDINAATRREWVPGKWKGTFNLPPSHALNLNENELLLDQTQGGPFVKLYGTPLVKDTDYRLVMNRWDTAVGSIQRIINGNVAQWDTGFRDQPYQDVISVQGVRGAAVDVPDEIAQATEEWAVIRWMQRSHSYLSGQSGPEELNAALPTDVLSIFNLLRRYTRFEGKQIGRVGTD